MPDFELEIVGATVEQWEDPATNVAPSRLNPRSGKAERRWIGTVGTAITLRAVVGGYSAPYDSQLGGRLFEAASAEAPHPYSVSFSHPVNTTSLQTFTPLLAGHYLVYMRRPEGGAWFVHIDAMEAA